MGVTVLKPFDKRVSQNGLPTLQRVLLISVGCQNSLNATGLSFFGVLAGNINPTLGVAWVLQHQA